MKKFILVIFTVIVVFNICGTIAILKRKGIDINLDTSIDLYIEINIYAFKVGVITAIVDRISRNSFKHRL